MPRNQRILYQRGVRFLERVDVREGVGWRVLLSWGWDVDAVDSGGRGFCWTEFEEGVRC
jgi:hypothetical protein